ncbi:MAG: molecular chaperone TorD family protein [Verrucomicrobiales bacterium]|nr:molecular chaperone TorD family protein [Verrucomicrobiales bacterium]
MPTPSETSSPPREWAATAGAPPRSIFGNFDDPSVASTAASAPDHESLPAGTAGRRADPSSSPGPLEAAIHHALARSFVYRFLANTFEDPTPANWRWLTEPATLAAFRASASLLGGTVAAPAEVLGQCLQADRFEAFHSAYLAAFGHAARGSCPLNEIEYGDIKADPLFQPHRLADLAAFYRAFGLEVAPDAGERHDHLGLELEFLCVLAAKDAYALEYQLDSSDHALCREAQAKFLREHLGRWTPAFARRLAASTEDPALRALAEFTRVFVESECLTFGVTPGSEELALRPVDEAADRMCDACGISNLPPGALSAAGA